MDGAPKSPTGSSWDRDLYIEAFRFAAERHNHQRFPGTDLPYILHVGLVAMEVIATLAAESGRDADLAVHCALLHDTLEDTDTGYQELADRFGRRVADGVRALTKDRSVGASIDDPAEQKRLRMADSLRRIREQPPEVWLVKMADRITNLMPPPAHWSREKIERYRQEARLILSSLEEASPILSGRLSAKIEEYGKDHILPSSPGGPAATAVDSTDGSFRIDSQRGGQIATILHETFGNQGIFGRTDMPEDMLPNGVRRGSLDHQMFITLTVAIDYQRDANALWDASRKTFDDPETRYLFDPQALREMSFESVERDMQKYGLSKKPRKDATIWSTVGVSFYKKWDGQPEKFLASCEWDCNEILRRLRADTHLSHQKPVPDYPYLRGPKIGPLWLRMLRDNVGIESLRKLDEVPIPVDIHVARATLAVGLVSGRFDDTLNEIFESVRGAWFSSVRGLTVQGRPMIALDVDEPLWHLSKYGCTYRDRETGICPKKRDCVVAAYCVLGKIRFEGSRVRIDT